MVVVSISDVGWCARGGCQTDRTVSTTHLFNANTIARPWIKSMLLQGCCFCCCCYCSFVCVCCVGGPSSLVGGAQCAWANT